tara:strand:+ start:1650 stop:1925 length:276 start_codon:yes stop_codon:yes gene_type:complete
LKVRQFLKKRRIESSEDLEMQMQLFAYIVAKHYSISLHEVYNMSEPIFRQSLSWALAINEEEKLEHKRQKVSDSDDTVEFDYTFLEMEEDF